MEGNRALPARVDGGGSLMTDIQPTLTDRINARERWKLDLSDTSYVTIFSLLENAIRDNIEPLTAAVNIEETQKDIDLLTELMSSLSELVLNSRGFESKSVTPVEGVHH